MHKSKLAGFIIDCQGDDPRPAATFWSEALGMESREFPGEEGAKYVRLVEEHAGLQIEVQAVDHESRVHLDIETDDVDAEVARLEALGARTLGRVKTWCVMRAPTGQKFCVIQAASPRFASEANVWGGGVA